METKRTKLWRRKQGFRVFKTRMIYQAAFAPVTYGADGCPKAPQHWFELCSEHWTRLYRSTGTPCSCTLCRGEKYSRIAYKRETRRILREDIGNA